MATKRWEKMVDEFLKNNDVLLNGVSLRAPLLTPTEAAKLLARQHRAFARMVKQISKRHIVHFPDEPMSVAYKHVCDDILAALAKQGARKKD